MSTTFAPSQYQQDIFDWFKNSSGNAFIEAVAGSGKTTTLVELSKQIEVPDAQFLSFNKSIAIELRTRTKLKVSTLNALGHAALVKGLRKRMKLRFNKYNNMIWSMLLDMNIAESKVGRVWRICKELVSFTMSNFVEPTNENLLELAEYYGIELKCAIEEQDMFNLVRSVLSKGEAEGRLGIIGFDDQIYLPVKWGMKPIRSSLILVDESQDLSKAKLELVLMSLKDDGRIIFVGDRRQSIYGFAGADARAVNNIIERTNATVLPLSVSYRCPLAAIRSAQEIVPSIQAAPGAIEGSIEKINEEEFNKQVKKNDLILCRTTTPLILLCLKMLKNKLPARVKGADIAQQIVMTVKEALGDRPWSEILPALDEYLANGIEALQTRKNKGLAIQLLTDRVEGTKACVENFTAKGIVAFEKEIEKIFSDDAAVIQLSTIHKAKGLEADNVFIIRPDKLPLIWNGQREWELEQEQNLIYVARTRCKQKTIYVEEDLTPVV